MKLAQQIFGDLNNKTALLIGAGETIELVIKHLHESNLRRMIIANRTLERSQQLAKEYSIYTIHIGDIAKHLAETDIVISCTASSLPIIGKGTVEEAIKIRKHKPMLMVDIAVPRDIEIGVGELDDVYLYSVDDLKGIVQVNLKNRQYAAKQAEQIIDIQAQEFMDWINSLEAVSTIRALRGQAESIQEEVLQKGLLRIKKGDIPEAILLEAVHTLTNKLIHEPSFKLKNASSKNRDDLLKAAEELYSLKNNDRKK